MVGSVNKVILVGNLGKDPDVRRLNSGDQVVSFSVATSETWRDKASGERKERTEWHNVVIFNENLGKVVEQYCKKGSKVYVEGRLSQRKYTDREGAQRTSIDVTITDMEMLTPKSASSSSEGYSAGSSDSGDPFLPDFPDE